MLMPVGLKGKERKKYIEKNAYNFATAPRPVPIGPRKRGLRPVGEVAPVVEEPKDVPSPARQEQPATSDR